MTEHDTNDMNDTRRMMHSSRTDQPRTVLLSIASAFVIGSAFAACSTDAPAADSTTVAGGTIATGAVTVSRTPVYVADVVQEWPHDPGAFTQGLVWRDGRLFEGTGQYGGSSIREVDVRTGRVLRKRDIDKKYFGEGIVLIGDVLYQITWQENVAFMYDVKTFAPKGQFKYEGEGWGLATDGTSIIMSNGSSALAYRDPKTFALQKSIVVTDNGQPVAKLNELEWVKDEIWANVWESDQIARIDPATGHVKGWIDLAGLLPRMDRTGKEDVLNGIAYDAKEDRLFVTGKFWPKLYEIRLKQRS